MEKKKPSNLKTKLLMFLPKAATTAITFHRPPLSPGAKPIITGNRLVSAEARRKVKNGSFDSREPTSPQISCIGQIKNKKKNPKPKPIQILPDSKGEKRFSVIVNGVYECETKVSNPAPSLNQMPRFVSGRGGGLRNFDWRANGAAVVPERNGEEEAKSIVIRF